MAPVTVGGDAGRLFRVRRVAAGDTGPLEAVDIDPASVSVESAGPGRAVIHGDDGRDWRALVGADGAATAAGPRRIEIVVDGWRFELEVEETRRAELRERATRRPADARVDGPLEIRAIIPGRIAAVSVAPGDDIVAGQTLLVVEAMKMQNELRAPRDGRVESVAVGAGETIDLGQLLVMLR